MGRTRMWPPSGGRPTCGYVRCGFSFWYILSEYYRLLPPDTAISS